MTQLERLAAYLAQRNVGVVSTTDLEAEEPDRQRDLVQLIEATGLSARDPDPRVAFKKLGDTMNRVAAAWPTMAPLFRVMLGNAMAREPALLCKGLWKSLFVMRTY